MFVKKKPGAHNVTDSWHFYLNCYTRLESGSFLQMFMYKIIVPQGSLPWTIALSLKLHKGNFSMES